MFLPMWEGVCTAYRGSFVTLCDPKAASLFCFSSATPHSLSLFCHSSLFVTLLPLLTLCNPSATPHSSVFLLPLLTLSSLFCPSSKAFWQPIHSARPQCHRGTSALQLWCERAQVCVGMRAVMHHRGSEVHSCLHAKHSDNVCVVHHRGGEVHSRLHAKHSDNVCVCCALQRG